MVEFYVGLISDEFTNSKRESAITIPVGVETRGLPVVDKLVTILGMYKVSERQALIDAFDDEIIRYNLQLD